MIQEPNYISPFDFFSIFYLKQRITYLYIGMQRGLGILVA